MKQFKFQALDSLGEIVVDNIFAKDEIDAKEKISLRKLILLKLVKKKKFISFFYNKNELLNQNQTSEFISNFSMMISTGLNIKDALEALKDSFKDKILSSFLKQTIQNLIRGESLANSIQISRPSISDDLIAMIRASESNGNLDLVLNGMNSYL